MHITSTIKILKASSKYLDPRFILLNRQMIHTIALNCNKSTNFEVIFGFFVFCMLNYKFFS